MNNENMLMTEIQAAEYLGVTRQCMSNWRYTGKGPLYVEISKKCIRYRAKDINEFIDSRIKKSTAQKTKTQQEMSFGFMF